MFLLILMVQYKIVLVGDCKTGKSMFRKWLQNHLYNDTTYVPTLGTDNMLSVINNKTVNIWDTAGLNNKYSGLREGYYINGDLFVIFGKKTQFYENLIKQTVGENAKIIYKNDINNEELLYKISQLL